MTNEEKVQEIAEREVHPIIAERCALEMAKWKDQQFKEYLGIRKKQAEEATKIFDDELHIRIHQSKINLINEIINELFKEE